ncbi:MAG: hypothetical protein AAF586_01210 [Planctomycetota bacterium]
MNRALRRALAVAAVVLAGLPSALAFADQRLHGMTVTCFRWGPGEWDGPHMAGTLDRLSELGVNSVALHPYGRISGTGAVRHSPGVQDPSLLVPAEQLAERGMTLMVKPHIAYWGSPWGWRGEIEFDNEADWRRFFADYKDFIVHQARIAERAGAAWFAVGTELELTTHRPEWGPIIDAVRAEFTGRLTYAANWNTVDRVPFWDRLDAVGVQFYFPISEAASPTDAQLRAGFEAALDGMLAEAARLDRPLLLTELGYPSHLTAAARPWDDSGPDTEPGFALAQRCLSVALSAIDRSRDERLLGVYLWKWFPTPRVVRREFALQYPQAEAVIAEHWAAPAPMPASAAAER